MPARSVRISAGAAKTACSCAHRQTIRIKMSNLSYQCIEVFSVPLHYCSSTVHIEAVCKSSGSLDYYSSMIILSTFPCSFNTSYSRRTAPAFAIAFAQIRRAHASHFFPELKGLHRKRRCVSKAGLFCKSRQLIYSRFLSFCFDRSFFLLSKMLLPCCGQQHSSISIFIVRCAGTALPL